MHFPRFSTTQQRVRHCVRLPLAYEVVMYGGGYRQQGRDPRHAFRPKPRSESIRTIARPIDSPRRLRPCRAPSTACLACALPTPRPRRNSIGSVAGLDVALVHVADSARAWPISALITMGWVRLELVAAAPAPVSWNRSCSGTQSGRQHASETSSLAERVERRDW